MTFTGSTAGGTKTASVTGLGTTYEVAVSGMTSQGTVIAAIPPGAAVDGAGNPSTASTPDDNQVTWDSVLPTVTTQAAGQTDPTTTSPINFTYAFSEAVSGFEASDVLITGSSGGTKTATITAGANISYNVAVTGMTTPGTVIASIAPEAVTDASGNGNLAPTLIDNVVTWDIAKANPTIVAQASAGGPLGTSVTDTATVSGGSSPTGSVTFRLFSNNTCAPWCSPRPTPWPAGPPPRGRSRPPQPAPTNWTAVYNGDANNVPGTVTVNPGGSLTVENSQLRGGIVANAPAFLRVCGAQIAPPAANPSQGIVVQNAAVQIRIGDPAAGCAGNRVASDITLTGGLIVGGYTVSRNVTVNTNSGPAVVVKDNTLVATGTTLACSGNNPPPTNSGQPNTAPAKTGQLPPSERRHVPAGSLLAAGARAPRVPALDRYQHQDRRRCSMALLSRCRPRRRPGACPSAPRPDRRPHGRVRCWCPRPGPGTDGHGIRLLHLGELKAQLGR